MVIAADFCAYAVILTCELVRLLRQHDLTRLEGVSVINPIFRGISFH